MGKMSFLSDEAKREYYRNKMREHRERKRLANPDSSKPRGRPRLYEPGPVGSAGTPSLVVPLPETLLSASRRAAAPYRSQIGMLMGDPPVGFSALDRRADIELERRLPDCGDGLTGPSSS